MQTAGRSVLPMLESPVHLPVPERFPRTLVAPVVTELAAVLEPVGRDPFLDGPDDGARSSAGLRWLAVREPE